jgi:RNA binding exosome subunit
MVGPNEYYVTFEKEGYQKATTGDIKIKEKDEVIKVDTGMEKLK